MYKKNSSNYQCASHGWLDTLAISMSIICAIHCLLTPILVVLLPILATTFWVHKDFHLWMLFFVLPTTSLAVFLGCKKHRDKFVVGLSAIGLGSLFAVAIFESVFHVNQVLQHDSNCLHCMHDGLNGHFNITALINILGGLFLASAHFRNYRLCRRLRCTHD